MGEMTIEQQRVLAMAAARVRLQEQEPEAKGFWGGAWEELKRAPEGLQRGLGDVDLAIQQIDARLPTLPLPGSQARTKGQAKFIAEQEQAIKDYETAREAAGAPGIDVARVAGSITHPATFVPAGIIAKAAPAATAMGRIAQGAISGGLLAPLTTPASPDADFATQKMLQAGIGTAVGSALPTGWEATKAIGRGTRNLLAPALTEEGTERAAGRLLGDVAGDKRGEIIRALMASQEVVPASRPTAGQAATPAGSAQFAGLQSLVAKADPDRYLGVTANQEAARLGHLGGFAGTADDLAAAIKARSTATKPLREAALAGAKSINAPLVVEKIDDVLQKPGLRASDVVTQTLGDVKKKISTLADEASGVIDADDLYMIRKEVGNTIQKYAQEAKNFDQRLTAGLERDVQKFIDDAIEAGGGAGWKKYLSTYAGMSRPIEQMEVGQQLGTALRTSLDTAERPAVFANAVVNAPRTIKTATGQSRYGELKEVLDPSQVKVVDAIMADLERNALFGRQARAGESATRKILSGAADPEGPRPNVLNRAFNVVGNIVDRIEGRATKRTMDKLAEVMTDPKMTAKIMQEATSPERKSIVDAIMAVTAAQSGSLAAR